MADSKISHLPAAPYLLDRDLMVVVTGSFNEGSYPQTCRVPVSYIRRYITRLDLLINTTSGIYSKYSPDLNILSLAATGLNAYGNNLIDIKYDNTWPHSGSISTTGLNINQTNGNLITSHIEPIWPYKHVLHTTGLNALDGENVGYCINDQWPFKYRFSTVSRSKYSSNNLSIANTGNLSSSVQHFIDPDLKISYKGFFLSKGYQTLNLLTSTKLRILSLSADPPPFVPGVGSTNNRKNLELQSSPKTIAYTYRYYDTSTNPPTLITTTRTKSDIQNYEWNPGSYAFIQNSCSFSIGLSGNQSVGIQNNIIFRNNSSWDTTPTFYAATYGSIGNTIQPLEYEAIVKPYLDSHLETNNNTISPQYSLSNIGYTRNYSLLLDNSPIDGPIYTTFTTPTLYTTTSASIYGNRYLSTNNIVTSDNCVGNTGLYMPDEDPSVDNYVTGGYFSNGILTLTRQGLSNINISIPTSSSSADGNNYATSLNFDVVTRILSLGRSGLPELSVTIPDVDTYSTNLLFDNISRNLTLQRSSLPDLIVNIPAVSSANSVRTSRTISTSTDILASDEVVFIHLDNQDMALNLPHASNMTGRTISIKVIANPNSKNCNISAKPGSTIDGKPSISVFHENISISLFSNSINWFII